jgi:hypothetical protein
MIDSSNEQTPDRENETSVRIRGVIKSTLNEAGSKEKDEESLDAIEEMITRYRALASQIPEEGMTVNEFLKVVDRVERSSKVQEIFHQNYIRFWRAGYINSRHHYIKSERPPQAAKILICLFLPKEDARIILGDLVEDYHEMRAKHGIVIARVLFWRQAVSVIWPTLRRLIIRLATLAGAGEVVRRIIG